MYNFELKIPTEIYFGSESLNDVGLLMRKHGRKVLMVYGSNRIVNTGLCDRIMEELISVGCQVVLCGGVKPNADVGFINAAVEQGRLEGIDSILAIGGGSVIDTAKAISVGFFYGGQVEDLYLDKATPIGFLPIGAIVTNPATASESNGMSVISDSVSGKKLAHFFEGAKPKFALLNPELTLTVSAYQTAVGGFDVFAHAFERYFDLNRDSQLLDVMTEGLMKTVIGVLPTLVKDPNDILLRSEMMLAATVAHNDMLGPGGDFACHQISHTLTEAYGVSHGGALAMIIPSWCEHLQEENPQRFLEFYHRIWGVETLDDGLSRLKNFIGSIGLPIHIDGKADDAKRLAKACVGTMGYIGGGFRKVTENDVKQILKRIIVPVA